MTITFDYVDRKGNQIIDASVEHLRTGVSVQTVDGPETMTFETVAVEPDNTAVATDYRLGHNYPNPFNPGTRFEVETLSSGTVTIYNILGQQIDNINLPRAGYYTVSWGGMNAQGVPVASGLYLYVLRADKVFITGKMILLDGGGSSGLELVSSNYALASANRVLAKAATVTDTLRFLKFNTSVLDFAFNHQDADTNLGDIIGNVGPTVLDTISDQVLNVGDTMRVNVDDFVYNDETGLYLPRDSTNFNAGGNIVSYIAVQPETLSTWIDVIDSTDNALRDSLFLRVMTPYVNQSPAQIQQILNQSIVVDSLVQLLISQYVADPDNDPLTADISGLQNATFQQIQDTLRIIPSTGYVGTIDSLVINISDGQHNIDLNPFNITVYEDSVENIPPEQVLSIPNQATNEDEALSLVMRPTYVIDANNDSLQYLINSLPNANYEVVADTITITPDNNYNGSIDSIVVNVSDGQASINLNPFSLEVLAVNDAPVFGGTVPNQEAVEDSMLTINAAQYFTDVDDDTLDYIIQNLGNNATQESNEGIITITPSEDWNGTLAGLVLEASDAQATAQSNEFSVIVNPVNDAPEFSGTVPNYTVSQDSSLLIPASTFFSDVDGDTLDYIIQNLSNATQTSDNGIVTVTPSAGWNGTISGLVLEAADSEYAAQSNSFDIEVEAPPMVDITFLFKAASPDTFLTSGVNVLTWRQMSPDTSGYVADLDSAIVTGYSITRSFPAGVLFDINGKNTESADDYFEGRAYTFIRKGADVIEQRSYQDLTAPIEFTQDDTLSLYKVMDPGQIVVVTTWLDQGEGTRRFENGVVPVWWNTSGDYLEPNEGQLTVTQATIDTIMSWPHVNGAIEYQVMVGDTAPEYPYIELVKDQNVTTPTNYTFSNDNNEIRYVQIELPPNFNINEFKGEFWEGTTDSYEVGGTSAPAVSGGEFTGFAKTYYSLNYIGKPKTTW